MIFASIFFIISLIALLGGAKLLVLGASNLAHSYGISSLIIGLTIVSFGTSAPEIAVSLAGAWQEEGGLVIGNIVGSNLFNILLVLGIGSVITPLTVKKRLIWWDVPIMIGATLLFWLFAYLGKIGHLQGVILLGGVTAYLITVFFILKKEPTKDEQVKYSLFLQIALLILGCLFLGFGSKYLIQNAVLISKHLGVSDFFIGLTVVAIGTSLPELVTTIEALRKKEIDLAVGNVIGSNLFNILGVLGISGLLSPTAITVPYKAFSFDLPILVGVSIATLPIFLTGHRISRWEGILFLFYYALYFIFLILEGEVSSYLPYFTSAFLFFILPLTILTLALTVIRHFKEKK